MLSFTILDISTVQKKLLDLCDNKNDVFFNEGNMKGRFLMFIGIHAIIWDRFLVYLV